MSLVAQKKSLRQHYRQLRRQISFEQQIIAARALPAIFVKNFFYQKKNIAVYLANDGEIDLQFLIEVLWQMGCAVFLPIIHPDEQSLCFVRYCATTLMKKNQYGILEPENATECISPEDLDVVLMPLVAFDYKGTRLGMGKGYYDKSFAFCRSSPVKPMLVGVAYECQYCETLPANAWDVPLEGIMTEKKFILLGKPS